MERTSLRPCLIAFVLLCVVMATVAKAARGGDAAGQTDVTAHSREALLTAFQGSLAPLEQRLFTDAADGRLDTHSLLVAALLASGEADPAALTRYQDRWAALVEELSRSERGRGTPRQQAQAAFEFLHRRLLNGGYALDCTDLRRAFDDGRYNCVSATVLLNCLAREMGLAPQGLELPSHAMSRIVLPDEALDIETTCPQWFRLIASPARQAELLEKAAGRPLVAGRVPAREVGDVQMAAMIYYNRGVDLLAENRFAPAAAVNARAVRLDPANSIAEGNLLATINNWAIALATAGQYAQAVDLLDQGRGLDPGYQAFATNYVYVHQQWIQRLCANGQYDEAVRALQHAAACLPERAFFRQALAGIQQATVDTAVMDGGRQ